MIGDNELLSSAELAERGYNRMAMRRAVEAGGIIQVARGLYVSPAALGETGLEFAVMSKIREGVVCMVSAASYHNLGDEMPSKVWYAVDRDKYRLPKFSAVETPHQLVYWNPEILKAGVSSVGILGVSVAITSPARTIVDLLRYRQRVGDETALRAFSDFLKVGGDMSEVWSLAEKMECTSTIDSFLMLADELKETIPTRSP